MLLLLKHYTSGGRPKIALVPLRRLAIFDFNNSELKCSTGCVRVNMLCYEGVQRLINKCPITAQ